MRKLFLIAAGIAISTVASAQEWKPAIEKWRGCAEAAAVRYSKSSESAQEAARLAALACNAEKKHAIQAVSQVEGVAFSEQFIEAAERHYIGVLSVKVIEMRLHSPEKR